MLRMVLRDDLLMLSYLIYYPSGPVLSFPFRCSQIICVCVSSSKPRVSPHLRRWSRVLRLIAGTQTRRQLREKRRLFLRGIVFLC